MIRRSISKSHKLASLSKESLILYFMMIPHMSSHGKMEGDPHFIKGSIVPLLNWFDIKLIIKCLKEITDKTNIKWFIFKGLYYIHSINWNKHQDFKEGRRGEDIFPDFKLGSLNLNSEVEVEVEVEVEEESKTGTTPALLRSKSNKLSHLSLLWNEICKSLPKVTKIPKSRLEKESLRLKDLPLSEWKTVFEEIEKTPFLTGMNERNWTATFDWIIANDSNYIKVLEGFYKRTPKSKTDLIFEQAEKEQENDPERDPRPTQIN